MMEHLRRQKRSSMMITTGSENQPLAKYSDKFQVVVFFIPGRESLWLSAAKAEELAIELNNAAARMRSEAKAAQKVPPTLLDGY